MHVITIADKEIDNVKTVGDLADDVFDHQRLTRVFWCGALCPTSLAVTDSWPSTGTRFTA